MLILWVEIPILALIDIKLNKRSHALPGYMPVSQDVRAAQDKVSKKLNFQNAAIKTEFMDGASGVRLAVLIDQNLYEGGSRAESWERVRLIFKNYAKRIKARLDEAHGK